jgi:membrane-associated phospholipid phosphatase
MREIIHIALCLLFLTTPVFADRGTVVKDEITKTGDVLQFAIPVFALSYSCYIRDWKGVEQLAYSIGATLVVTYALKYTIREERPYQDEDTKGTTFPSGHTSIAFSGAGYCQMRYGWRIGAPMYAAASFVGYSRNHARMHNWFDILAGAAIGIGANLLFTTKYNNENTHISMSRTNGGTVLCLNINF